MPILLGGAVLALASALGFKIVADEVQDTAMTTVPAATNSLATLALAAGGAYLLWTMVRAK